eukprot:4133706-Amphidinium_carterae.3
MVLFTPAHLHRLTTEDWMALSYEASARVRQHGSLSLSAFPTLATELLESGWLDEDLTDVKLSRQERQLLTQAMQTMWPADVRVQISPELRSRFDLARLAETGRAPAVTSTAYLSVGGSQTGRAPAVSACHLHSVPVCRRIAR